MQDDNRKTNIFESLNENVIIVIFLSIISIIVLSKAPAYFSGTAPIGDDSSSHIVACSSVAKYLKEFDFNMWQPAVNLGYPLIHYYQPVSHILTGVTALILGGPEKAVLAYKIWVVLLMAFFPFAYFLAFRRMGVEKKLALFLGLTAGTLSSKELYGFSYEAFFYMGLYSVLWGSIVLPFALVESLRYLRGEGKLVLAAPLLSLLYLTHSFLGTNVVAVVAFGAFVVTPFSKSALFATFRRLIYLGIFFSGLTLFWTLPMLMTHSYMGGWPFGDKTKIDGWGILALLTDLFTGDLTDYSRFHYLVFFTLIGVFAGGRLFVKEWQARIAIGGLLLTGFFLSGRTTFGWIVDLIYPPNVTMIMNRYQTIFGFFVIIVSAFGANYIIDILNSFLVLGEKTKLVVAFLMALPLIYSFNTFMNEGLQTRWGDQIDPSFETMNHVLKNDPNNGRFYSHGKLKLKTHWDMYLPAFYSGKSGGQCYGAGHHDSMNFFYLEYIEPCGPNMQKLAELFNIRYLISSPRVNLDHIPDKTLLFESRTYRLYKLSGEYGYFSFIANPSILKVGSPRLARPIMLNWMQKDYIKGKPFLRLEKPVCLGFPPKGDTSLLVNPHPVYSIEPDPEPYGKGIVMSEEIHLNVFESMVCVHGPASWLLLKVTPHPFFKAYIDGSPTDIYQLSPAMMGIRVPEGNHKIRFEYKVYSFQKLLFILAILTLAGLLLWGRSFLHGQKIIKEIRRFFNAIRKIKR